MTLYNIIIKKQNISKIAYFGLDANTALEIIKKYRGSSEGYDIEVQKYFEEI